MLIHRLKRLYDQLNNTLTPFFKGEYPLLAVVALVIGLSIQMAHGQWFAPPKTNPFLLPSVGNFAAPDFVDIDGDGDFDMFAGRGDGNFTYSENTGTNTAPVFATPQANPFGLTDVGDLSIPDFVDIDGDGDFDAFMGETSGNLQYFENTGDSTSPAFALPQVSPFGLTDVGNDARPSFVDIDGDGDFDVFVGKTGGTLQYFKNTGTKTAPAFAAPQTNPFGLVSINLTAYPDFVDIDEDGSRQLAVGSRQSAVSN